MALVHSNITVGTTPTLLVSVPEGVGYTAVQICNNHNQPIYLGSSSVGLLNSATVGNALPAGSSVQLWLNANDTVYAISSAATTANSISVLYSGV